MGGHGGLNILPQKKWNVWNWDNKQKVEKDVREAKEKEDEKNTRESRSQAELRIEILKIKNKKQKREEKWEEKQKMLKPEETDLQKELKETLTSSQNINLFQEEEKLVDIQANTQARNELERDKFKDLPYDQSSKFMGSLSDKDKQPWYLRTSNVVQTSHKQRKFENRKEMQSQNELASKINEFQQYRDNYYQVLDIPDQIHKNQQRQYYLNNDESIEIEQNNQLQLHKKEDKKQKKDKKHKKKEKKEKKKRKYSNSDSHSDCNSQKEFEQDYKKQQIQKLRQDRIKREEIERLRQLEVIKKYNKLNNCI